MTRRPPSPEKERPQTALATSKSVGEAVSRAVPKKSRNMSKRLAKSNDPAYMKFTTYIKKSTHRGVKTRLVSREKELSDLVEELLFNWLKDNDSFTI
jgi:hypothetical protein